jgi:putative alpha-1,2-mannosidase
MKSVENPEGEVSSTSGSTRVGGLFTFEESEIISRVGISWISTEQACDNVDREIPKGTDFTSVVDDTVSEWNEKVFSKIKTTSTNSDSLNLLYSSLYHMHLIPTNQTDENPGWKSREPYYQDIFTFWVSPRCLIFFPLLQIHILIYYSRTSSDAQRPSCKSSNQPPTKNKSAL